jgi:hypothetical protein
MNAQTLRVQNYGKTAAEDRRITISPMHAIFCSAKTEDTVLDGRSLREVDVYFDGGGVLPIIVNHSDLELLENTIGFFCND